MAQEAALRAWRARGDLRRGERRREWLARIVRNEAARHLTRAAPEPLVQSRGDRAADDERVIAAPDRLDLRRALRDLGPADRLLLLLRYGEDMTQPAIARLLDVPEGTVKVRLHRARTRLRRAYAQG